MNPTSQEFKNREAVRQYLADQIESLTVPEKVSAYAQAHEGKPFTSRDLSKLKEATGLEWFIRKEFGMTTLETRGYQLRRYASNESLPDSECISLLMAHAETGVLWMNGPTLEVKNPAYYEGARTRNKLRMEGMNSTEFLDQLFSVAVVTLKAVRELKRQKEIFDELTAYGKPGDPDSHDLSKIVGLYGLDLGKA